MDKHKDSLREAFMNKGSVTDTDLPAAISIFGQSAVQTNAGIHDPLYNQWNEMLRRQQWDLKFLDGKGYFAFLKQFDGLRERLAQGEPLGKIAAEANQIVSRQIKDQPTFIDYFGSPVETVHNGHGSSQDIAALNEAILQYMGVPDSRMLVARVNSHNDITKGVDYTVLLVNDAPEGAAPHFFVVMSHFDQTFSADQSGWMALSDARNQRGTYYTPKAPPAPRAG
jgi:hypothetical protein